MITHEQWQQARDRAWEMLSRAGIVITPDEAARMEVADFGLGELEQIGLQIVVYVNTQRVCAKELVMFPWQICPEHLHPKIGPEPGKEETFRCRWGEMHLYVPGPAPATSLARLPSERAPFFSVHHKILLQPGEQYTLAPETLHWFQAGEHGAIVSEFSTRSMDEHDVFTDPYIRRLPVVA